MTRVTRRTAIGFGTVSLVVATTQVASALPSANSTPTLVPGEQGSVKNLEGALPSPLSSVQVKERNLALSLEFTGGKTEALSDSKRTRVTVQGVPSSLVLVNIGSEPVPAGTRVVVRSAGLDATGLVTGAKQPVLVHGMNNNVNDWLVMEQENGGTTLTLRQDLSSGHALTVDLAWALGAGTAFEGGGKVQVLASVALVTSSSNYYEAQSPEVILSRLT